MTTKKNERNEFNSKRYVMGWVGGKNIMRRKIVPYIPNTRFHKFVEVFGGTGSMLLYRDKWARLEVYNDIDSRLTNLFNVLKYHHEPFLEELNSYPVSREQFERFLIETQPTDIKRAVAFFYVYVYSWSCMGTTFRIRDISQHIDSRLSLVADRLKRVTIEKQDYETLIRKNDLYGTFFYCDPPYFCRPYYKYNKENGFDHNHFSEVIKGIKGKFLISYNDCEEARNLYSDCYIVEVPTMYQCIRVEEGGNRQGTHEILIANYDLEETAKGSTQEDITDTEIEEEEE